VETRRGGEADILETLHLLVRAEQRGCRVGSRRERRVGRCERRDVVELKLLKVIVRRSFREAELMASFLTQKSGH
jgi:hypothetical protein